MDSGNDESKNDEKAFLDDIFDSASQVPVLQKTHVSIFHELCTKFDFGVPIYDLIEESGEAHQKIFRISLTVWFLGISVVGKASTKMHAKHDAALKMMMQLKKAAQTGGVLNSVTDESLTECVKWMKKCEYQNEVVPQHPRETKNSAGILLSVALTNHLDLPKYEVVSITGPSHCRKFVMTCVMNGHSTIGEGKSKKICKNIVAEEMLLILHDQIQD